MLHQGSFDIHLFMLDQGSFDLHVFMLHQGSFDIHVFMLHQGSFDIHVFMLDQGSLDIHVLLLILRALTSIHTFFLGINKKSVGINIIYARCRQTLMFSFHWTCNDFKNNNINGDKNKKTVCLICHFSCCWWYHTMATFNMLPPGLYSSSQESDLGDEELSKMGV